MSEICPFCGCDPFEYVDVGVGRVPVAVTCCELGDLFFRGARSEPEEVSMPWADFFRIGCSLAGVRAGIRTLEELS